MPYAPCKSVENLHFWHGIWKSVDRWLEHLWVAQVSAMLLWVVRISNMMRMLCVIQSTGSAAYGADILPTSSSNMYDAHMR